MRHAYGNANGDSHIHTDGDGNCDIHSDCDGNCYSNSDGDSHGYGDSNCDRTAAAFTDATASTDTAGPSEHLLFREF